MLLFLFHVLKKLVQDTACIFKHLTLNEWMNEWMKQAIEVSNSYFPLVTMSSTDVLLLLLQYLLQSLVGTPCHSSNKLCNVFSPGTAEKNLIWLILLFTQVNYVSFKNTLYLGYFWTRVTFFGFKKHLDSHQNLILGILGSVSNGFESMQITSDRISCYDYKFTFIKSCSWYLLFR